MTNDEIVRALRCYASDCNDDDACNQCTFAWMCDKCDGNAPEIIAARIDSLTSQLADSQRREQAAVEDIIDMEKSLPYGVGCYYCKHYLPAGGDGDCKNCNFEWRGPQAGKGEAE